MLLTEVHQVSISYVFWLGNLLLLAYSLLGSCLQRTYTLTLSFDLSIKRESIHSYLYLRQSKVWYWLYPFAPSLQTVFSTRRAPSAYSVHHLTLTDRLTSPQPVGEKQKKNTTFLLRKNITEKASFGFTIWREERKDFLCMFTPPVFL